MQPGGRPLVSCGTGRGRRKALTAVTAKMARVVHAVVKGGTEYRPFVEGGGAKRKNPSQQCREGAVATL